MSRFKNMNIQQLISEQIEIGAEISARIKVIEQSDNSFHTYCPNGNAEDYKTLMEVAVECLRKGQGIKAD